MDCRQCRANEEYRAEEVKMSLDEHRGNTAVENDLKYLLLFGSKISDDASVKFPSLCRREACVKHVRSRRQVERLSTSP
jgi:hypothetical protein